MNKDNEWFGVVRWSNYDIRTQLLEMGISPTQENIDLIRTACDNDHHFTDGMIQAGWDAIENKIQEVLLNKKEA